MSENPKPTCKVIRSRESYEGKQALTYMAGIAAENTGSQGICMHLLNMPPKERARAHLHENHETAIYVISGQAGMWFGERLARPCRHRQRRLPLHPRRHSSPALQPQRNRNLHCRDRPDGPQRTRERQTLARAGRDSQLDNESVFPPWTITSIGKSPNWQGNGTDRTRLVGAHQRTFSQQEDVMQLILLSALITLLSLDPGSSGMPATGYFRSTK